MIINELNSLGNGKVSAKQRMIQLLRNYQRDESGALLIFGLMIVIMMFVIGGFAVNIMRYERVRVDLAQTLERASLAAASLSQTVDPKEVVKDYMKKNGMLPLLKDVKVTQTANGRIVKAEAMVDVPFFMARMIGVDELPAYAGATARQDITDVEIMLVLDISGSMGEPDGAGSTKIAALRKAAAEFVDQMLTPDSEDHISIGMVPYNANVNLGPALISKFTVVSADIPARASPHTLPSSQVPDPGQAHGRSAIHCVDIPDALFATRGIPRTSVLQRTAYNDVAAITLNFDAAYQPLNQGRASTNYRCGRSYPDASLTSFSYITMPTNNKTTLKTAINGLWADGNTSIFLGFRWGLALLDPSARSIFSEMSGSQVPAIFNDRPFDYTKEDTMKVIVLMTDGYHYEHARVLGYGMATDYRSGSSPIFRDTAGNLILEVPKANLPPASVMRNIALSPGAATHMYWHPHLTSASSNTTTNATSFRNAWYTSPQPASNSTVAPVRLTWQEVWALKVPDWVIWHLYARSQGGVIAAQRNIAYDAMKAQIQPDPWKTRAEMDALLKQSCDLAKTPESKDARPVDIYTIAFNAPNEGKVVMKDCATAPKSPYYLEVDSTKSISQAFAEIASSINALRLTQ